MHLMPISVFIADDHKMLVEGMRQTLVEAGFLIAGVAHSADRLVETYCTLQPDVLLIDIRFEHSQTARNGLDVCAEILAQKPGAVIVVCSQFDSLYFVKEALNVGVTTYVCKSENPAEIVTAVKAAALGRRYIAPMTADILEIKPGYTEGSAVAA